LDEYIKFDSKVSLDFPKEIKELLDTQVMDYLDDILQEANRLLQEFDNILFDFESTSFDNEKINARGIISFSAAWVEWGINVPLAIINAGLVTVRYIPFLGKSMFVKAVKSAIPAVLQTLASLNSAFTGIRATVSGILSSSSDAMILRWFTIGGIVANIVDICDKDGFNGYITF